MRRRSVVVLVIVIVALASGLLAVDTGFDGGARRARRSSPQAATGGRTGPLTEVVQPIGIPGTWHLVLDSEFDGTGLPADWRSGWFGDAVTDPVNGSEDDCYSPANISFPGDGTMHLNVTQTRSHCRGVTKPFSGALVSTNPDDGRAGSGFQYGYGVLEARVYIPADGSEIADWPAVWADGQHWPEDGEDDVMEGLGGRACWHFQIPPGAPSRGCDTSLTPGWHTFASDWRAGSVTFFYDGVDVGAVTSGITAAPMYLVLDNTTKAINPIADAMKVQYVRVWQR